MTQAARSLPAAPAGKMTYEEFLNWADSDTYAEWVDGEVVYVHRVMDPATGEILVTVTQEHNLIGQFLMSLIGMFVDLHKLGLVFYEPFQMKTGHDLPGRSPDIIFVANKHRQRLRRTYLDGAADLVVEIVSEESRDRDRREKYREYEQGSVREYWVIDPERRQAEFFVLGENGAFVTALRGAVGRYESTVLPGLWLQVEWLWADSRPTVLDVLRAWGLV